MIEENMVNPSSADDVPILEMRGICKYFGPIQALDTVDFKINQREVVGLLGDNGAGKSTLIKMMSGLLCADQGEILFYGKPVVMNSRQDSERLTRLPEERGEARPAGRIHRTGRRRIEEEKIIHAGGKRSACIRGNV